MTTPLYYTQEMMDENSIEKVSEKLPYGLTVEMLRGHHKSIPANPLLARPMYLYGSIEQVGTGTEMILEQCFNKGLKKPQFIQDVDFSIILYRLYSETTDHVDTQVTRQVPDKHQTSARQVPDKYQTSTRQVEKEEIKRVVMVLNEELSRSEIQNLLGLKNRKNFLLNYLNPALEQNCIELIYPDSPNHPQQKYCLTAKGLELKKKF